MMARLLGALVCLMLVTALVAAEVTRGTVVSYDKDTMKLVVKVGDKERTVTLTKKTHVHDVDDREVKLTERADKLKKGARIEIEEEGGKLIEINIKK